MKMDFWIKEKKLPFIQNAVKKVDGRFTNNPAAFINKGIDGILVAVSFKNMDAMNTFSRLVHIIKQSYF